ncbi:MAG: 30S ribosomal protein S6 [Defluviitaleaceae bacterium]|nr:30S ribosomal protein S6 [Defluviitaleaceae bacterium]
MHKYEMGIILLPTMEEEAIKAEHDLILELLERFGGVIEKVDNWGRRKLAYEIQKLNEGHYCFFYMDAPPELPAQMEQRLRIRENVMRFMIIRREDLEKAPKNAAVAPAQASAPAPVAVEEVVAATDEA